MNPLSTLSPRKTTPPTKDSAIQGAENLTSEIEFVDDRLVDISRFKPDLSPEDIKSILKGGDLLEIFPFYFLPIETLLATKTIGRGRTNLTLIRPTIVQTDATTPSASFNRQATPSRNPAIEMHFEPSAYGVTSVATYLMQFTIAVSGQATFHLGGFAGSGTVMNTGTKILSGQTRVSLILKNVPASQQTFGFLEQIAGGEWTWFATLVSFPPLVVAL